ncbi:putative major intrinsic protein [Rosa chinensis]|uniref:Putative major intrinsic protein n=1 Tax=Rosa chinensis TaxID=74649 RepID=A0A2P6Q541_ROSCH|nr:putative major intrinsic protein [Rosa chinensis]
MLFHTISGSCPPEFFFSLQSSGLRKTSTRNFLLLSRSVLSLSIFLFISCFLCSEAMAENHASDGNHVLNVEDDKPSSKTNQESSSSLLGVLFLQKVIAEVLGTYFLIFAGCGAVVVNFDTDKMVSSPAVAIVWGLVVMVMIYSVGHISGAHFNPAVTIAFATTKRFPWKQVLPYIAAQVLGSTLASVSGVATDNRAIGELAGLAVGSTILLNVMFAGPITGASMNPARSLGPAIVSSHYKNLWIYLVSPTLGAVCGALVYNVIRFTDKPLRELTKSGSFLKGAGCT